MNETPRVMTAEEALRESEERFRGTFENAAVGIAHTDIAGHFLRVNEKFCTIVGYPREELLQRTFQDITHPDDLASSLEPFSALMRGESPGFGLKKRYRRKDGSLVWVELFVSLQRDAAGEPAYAIAMLQDISQRKRLEEELRESEHRWRSLTEALPQLVWSAAPDGTCDYFSTQWTEHTGVAESDLLGWRWLEVLHPDDRERTRRFWLDSVAGRGPYDVEYRVRRADGAYCWFKTRGTPIRDDTGDIVKWFGSCTDITDLRQTEEALREAKEAAESANRAKDEFLANVSHEIRTPMNAILGMTELALDTPLSDDQRHWLKTVKAAADNLLGIINDLLDFSKIEAGKLELDAADFSLRTALDDTLRALAVRAHKKGLQLAGHVQPDVPDSLVGDAGRLRQVLLNLVDNAIKFTEVGEVVVEVHRKDEQDTEDFEDSSSRSCASSGSHASSTSYLLFSVRDSGIGIPPDKQGKIFRAFEQEDTSTTRKYGGTGLGLTIAARLVALMGGTITVDSALGRGSTFAFTARLGIQPHPPEPVAALPPESLSTGHSPLTTGLHILVAEDNDFNAQLLEQLLVRRGCRVQVATNGREALSLAVSGEGPVALAPCPSPLTPHPSPLASHPSPLAPRFDLLLLDVHMPELDGFQVIGAIRERERSVGGHLPVIALTARSRKEDRERCLAAGMDDFLAKPIQAADLWEAIDRVVAAHPQAVERNLFRLTEQRNEFRSADLERDESRSTSLLDARVLLAACGDDAAILAKICQAFRTGLPNHLTAIQDVLSKGDTVRLREAAHKLCGMVAAFSTVAGNVASDLEDHAAQGKLEEARPLVEKLETMAHELLRLVNGLSLESLRQQEVPDPNRGRLESVS